MLKKCSFLICFSFFIAACSQPEHRQLLRESEPQTNSAPDKESERDSQSEKEEIAPPVVESEPTKITDEVNQEPKIGDPPVENSESSTEISEHENVEGVSDVNGPKEPANGSDNPSSEDGNSNGESVDDSRSDDGVTDGGSTVNVPTDEGSSDGYPDVDEDSTSIGDDSEEGVNDIADEEETPSDEEGDLIGGMEKPKFIDNGDGTITDSANGIMWIKKGIREKVSYDVALRMAQQSEEAGYSDWRLPSFYELSLLRSKKKVRNASGQKAWIHPMFDDGRGLPYFTTTTCAELREVEDQFQTRYCHEGGKAVWVVQFAVGAVFWGYKDRMKHHNYNIWLVRDIEEPSLSQ